MWVHVHDNYATSRSCFRGIHICCLVSHPRSNFSVAIRSKDILRTACRLPDLESQGNQYRQSERSLWGVSSFLLQSNGSLHDVVGLPEEKAENQEELEDILAGPSATELPHLSGVFKRDSDNSEDDIKWHTSIGEGYDSGVEEENQEGGSEAEDANQAVESDAENGNQDDDNEGQERNAEGIDQQNGRAVQSYIATLDERLLAVIRDCDRIPDNRDFPWQCSQSFLKKLKLDTVKHKIEAIDASLNAVSQLDGLLKFYIIDLQVLHRDDRRRRSLESMSKSLIFLRGYYSNEIKVMFIRWDRDRHTLYTV